MPELPEVETTVRGLTPVLSGQRLTLVETRRADLRRAFPVDLRQRMTGAVVTSLGRRAKYGLIDTDRGDTMIFHLGMSGRWRIDPGEAQRHNTTVDAYAAETAQRWKTGLAEWDQDGARIARLKAAADVTVYTPGSRIATPLAVLGSLGCSRSCRISGCGPNSRATPFISAGYTIKASISLN